MLVGFTLYQVKRSEEEIENIKKNKSKAGETIFLLMIEVFYFSVCFE